MILSAPARHVGIPDELTLPSKLLSVETSRRNQTLKYAWDRDLADLSDAEVLELAPYRVHIKYVLEKYELDMANSDLDPATLPTAEEVFAELDELLLASEIVTTGMLPYYLMVVDNETAQSKIINIRANTDGRRFMNPLYHYAFQMILQEIDEAKAVVEK